VLAAGAQPGSETICHIPGNSESAHTLVVSAAALPSHLGHGDLLGFPPRASRTAGRAGAMASVAATTAAPGRARRPARTAAHAPVTATVAAPTATPDVRDAVRAERQRL
jgi:hypothetical protein